MHDILVLWREEMTALWLYRISKEHQKKAFNGIFLRKSWFTQNVWVKCCAKSRTLHMIWEVEFDAPYQMHRLVISTKTWINFWVTCNVGLDLLFLLYREEISIIIENMWQTSCVLFLPTFSNDFLILKFEIRMEVSLKWGVTGYTLKEI